MRSFAGSTASAVSRGVWIGLGAWKTIVHARLTVATPAREKFAWSLPLERVARELIGRPVGARRSLGRRAPALPGPRWAWGPVPVALLMLLYLSLMMVLALWANRAFLLNDVIAFSVFALLLAGAATMEGKGRGLARVRGLLRR